MTSIRFDQTPMLFYSAIFSLLNIYIVTYLFISFVSHRAVCQARRALKTALDFFKRLQDAAVEADMSAFQLLQLRDDD